MKKVLLLSFLFSFALIGCTPKTQIVFKDKIVCIEQQKINRVETTQIRVHNDDVRVAAAYIEHIYSTLSFYENQVDRNNKFCKEIEK